jgi:flagellar protein FliS
MSGFGAQSYSRVAVDSGVGGASPHRLVLMLFDGAIDSIRLAEAHLAARQIPAKCAALSKASRIIDSGLKAGINRSVDPLLASRLILVYDYTMVRLLHANARNDVAAMHEARQLLGGLRDAWAAIGPAVAAGAASVANSRAAVSSAASYGPAQRAAPAPARRLAVTG